MSNSLQNSPVLAESVPVKALARLTVTLEFLPSYLFACVAQSQAISFELSTTQTAA